jgi:hypothetical protein
LLFGSGFTPVALLPSRQLGLIEQIGITPHYLQQLSNAVQANKNPLAGVGSLGSSRHGLPLLLAIGQSKLLLGAHLGQVLAMGRTHVATGCHAAAAAVFRLEQERVELVVALFGDEISGL